MSASTTGETGQVPAATAGQVPAVTTSTTTPPAASTEQVNPETGKVYTEAEVKALRAEAADYRTKLRKLEQAEEARNLAALSETERLQKTAADAEARAVAAESRARTALANVALSSEAAALGLPVALAVKLAGPDVAFDADGQPTNVKALLTALVKDYPQLVSQSAPNVTNPPRGGASLPLDPKALPRLGMGGLFKIG